MPPNHMRRTCSLLFILLSSVIAFSQKRSNPKVGKTKPKQVLSYWRTITCIRRAICLQVCYIKKLKIGAGVLYGANYVDSYDPEFYGYGAVFADALQFLGHREKWSFGAQVGHGIYNHELGYDVKLQAAMYWSISCNYRAIPWLWANENFSMTSTHIYQATWVFLGLKFGVVF